MRIAYFVHDLSDAAVKRRVEMLQLGGAEVLLFGFRRTAAPPATLAGAAVHDLGRTADAQLGRRAMSVAANLLRLPAWRGALRGVDVFLARNLEVLVLAAVARSLHAPRARLAYECLDIHRVMLGDAPLHRMMRRLEGSLLARSDVLMVSSPAFLTHYFEPMHRVGSQPRLKVMLLENKVFGGVDPAVRPPPAAPGPPWRIGWFGMIRCRRSLDALSRLAARRPDLLEVVIRGRPSRTEFDDFDAQVSALPNLHFFGRYGPEDLPAIYGDVHFNWAVDYFQDEGNSRWLLPNRLYEGGLLAAPPIARHESEAATWLAKRNLGILFQQPEIEIEAFLDALTPSEYATIAARHASAPKEFFLAGAADCRALVDALGRDTPAASAESHSKADTGLGVLSA